MSLVAMHRLLIAVGTAFFLMLTVTTAIKGQIVFPVVTGLVSVGLAAYLVRFIQKTPGGRLRPDPEAAESTEQ